MPAHRRPTRTGRRIAVIGAAVTVLAGAATTTMVLSDSAPATASASDAPAPAAPVTAVDSPVALDTPAVQIAPLAQQAAEEPFDAFAEIMQMAGYPTDPDTAAFMDTSVTSICRDLAVGRTGVDILADTADRTRVRGWSDEQSDGLVYIGVASTCSAYSHLLP
ncbi:hypothetical protein HQ305_21730 [Rhodococcus sp. BP-149]|uniref:hypothetical protein n=1 Tax=unclassified Rhodococcus (in: high G+C Gram-positive bacteria) TaxID=192944 RepID=UPI001C9B1051|nr:MULTISPECIES: hypothetical protein [unclassified Rhodococcus (in: high G+C Gram-positive bacteria)]MBY6685236.1 hypothetical protein [Rhodococcus sp. BP-288]MBY6696314.1 hypothetical protein [Rhodococcus sp. BP-188]MBY6698178.1 hypothetical protein [Rhodococcus sp. BP-285]MBY6705108.1 hypothetical protein [Rhodococcus sp. BP-283]MBY6706126.1 hypothetical protein [Rhodococcus sp. BP-241]